MSLSAIIVSINIIMVLLSDSTMWLSSNFSAINQWIRGAIFTPKFWALWHSTPIHLCRYDCRFWSDFALDLNKFSSRVRHKSNSPCPNTLILVVMDKKQNSICINHSHFYQPPPKNITYPLDDRSVDFRKVARQSTGKPIMSQVPQVSFMSRGRYRTDCEDRQANYRSSLADGNDDVDDNDDWVYFWHRICR